MDITRINDKNQAGIYIHIPFCKSRCNYCDFYTITNETNMDLFVEALCKEAIIRKDEITKPIRTIYFGGGTPSRLHYKHLEKIFNTIFSNYNIDDLAEITVEANPDDMSQDYVRMLSELPVNRLSIGIQSFNDNELKFLSRRHTAKQAVDAVERAQKFGLTNISIDLMYGLPNQTLDIWRDNLKMATNLGTKHLSAYHLIYEEKTLLKRLLDSGKIKPVDEEISRAMFSILIDWMKQRNFIHYEISAFAKDGFFSRHNTSYWKSSKYIGLGPAAHSFDGENRSWNVASLSRYIKGAETGNLDRGSEHLSQKEKYNEFILTGLRTIWGVDLRELQALFGDEFFDYCIENAAPYKIAGKLNIEGDYMKLTRDGMFISDGIMSDLMMV